MTGTGTNELPEQFPIEQGLKQDPETPELQRLRNLPEQFPIEQGLKLETVRRENIAVAINFQSNFQ